MVVEELGCPWTTEKLAHVQTLALIQFILVETKLKTPPVDYLFSFSTIGRVLPSKFWHVTFIRLFNGQYAVV